MPDPVKTRGVLARFLEAAYPNNAIVPGADHATYVIFTSAATLNQTTGDFTLTERRAFPLPSPVPTADQIHAVVNDGNHGVEGWMELALSAFTDMPAAQRIVMAATQNVSTAVRAMFANPTKEAWYEMVRRWAEYIRTLKVAVASPTSPKSYDFGVDFVRAMFSTVGAPSPAPNLPPRATPAVAPSANSVEFTIITPPVRWALDAVNSPFKRSLLGQQTVATLVNTIAMYHAGQTTYGAVEGTAMEAQKAFHMRVGIVGGSTALVLGLGYWFFVRK